MMTKLRRWSSLQIQTVSKVKLAVKYSNFVGSLFFRLFTFGSSDEQMRVHEVNYMRC